VPDDVLAEARAAAQADGRAGYKLTLRMPSFLPVTQYAHDRALRRSCTRRTRRARPTFRAPGMGQRARGRRILALRREARSCWATATMPQVSLVPKMAQNPDEVIAFLRDLARRAKPFAERDFGGLAEFARDELGLAELMPWDVAYARSN